MATRPCAPLGKAGGGEGPWEEHPCPMGAWSHRPCLSLLPGPVSGLPLPPSRSEGTLLGQMSRCHKRQRKTQRKPACLRKTKTGKQNPKPCTRVDPDGPRKAQNTEPPVWAPQAHLRRR